MSVFPIIRMAAKMHDCKDEDCALLDTEDNAVWKAVNETAPDIFIHNRPGSRIGDNVLYGGKYFDGKIVSKPRPTFLVIINGSVELCFCLGMK